MLRGKLYMVDEMEQIHFQKDHPIFRAHFPGQPIVPGACLMQMVEEELRLHIKPEGRLVGARNVKFLKVARPENVLTVHYELVSGNEYYVEIKDAENLYAKMYIEYTGDYSNL